MDFKLKDYQIIRAKRLLKNEPIVFYYNSTRLNYKQWLIIEQTLRDKKLNYLKILNSTSLKVFNDSIFKKFDKIIKGIVIFVTFDKNYGFNFKNTSKDFKNLFVLLSLKLNDKIYSASTVKKVNKLNYKNNLVNILQTLDISSKKIYLFSRLNSK